MPFLHSTICIRVLMLCAALALLSSCGPKPGAPKQAEARLLTPIMVFEKLGDRFSTHPVFTNPEGAEILGRGFPAPEVSNPAKGNPELTREFARALSTPTKWRELDREHHFGVVYLGGSPMGYRPLLAYLLQAQDWAIFHVDHLGIAFVRKPAEPWTIADLDAIKSKFAADRKNDQVAFLSRCASILIELDDYANADRYLNDAFQLNPERPDAWTAKAVLAAKRQQWSDAESAAAHALQLEPAMLPAKYVRAQALFALNMPAEALPLAESLLKDAPKDPAYLLLYSKVAHGVGDSGEEIRALEALIAIVQEAGGSPSGYRIYLGQAYSADHKPEQALTQFKTALEAGDLDPQQREFALRAVDRLDPGSSRAQ